MSGGLLLKIAKAALPYLLILCIAVFMMHDIFQQGILTKSDNPVHMVEASFLANTAFPKYHWINGWYQNESGGMPLQLYFYQFGYWLILLLHFLFGLSLELAYKCIVVFAQAFPALALYFLLSKKFGRIVAFFPSLFYIFQLDNTKMFLAGMWNNGLGLGFLVLLFYFLDKYSKNKSMLGATAAGLSFSAIIVSHYLVAIAAAYLVAIYFIIDRGKIIEKLLFYGWIPVFSGLLMLFYTFPFIETSGWLAFDIGWGLGKDIVSTLYALVGIFLSLKPLLPAVQQAMAANYSIVVKDFFMGFLQNLPMLTVDVLAFLGLAYFAKNKTHKEHDFLKITLVFIALSLILGSGFWFLMPSLNKLPFLSSILAYRFLYYGRIGLIIFAAFAISQIWKKTELPNYLHWLKLVFKYKNKLATAFVLLFFILLLSGQFFPPKDFTETTSRFALTNETLGVISWLVEKNTDTTVRTLFQGFFGNIKDSALPVYFIYQHNLSSFGAWATTQSPVQLATTTEEGQMFSKHVRDISPEEIFEKSKAYNIKYFVAVEPKLQDKLANSEYFKSEKKFEHFEIFSVRNFVSKFVESENDLDSVVTNFGDHEVTIKITNNYESNKANIKMTYHPYWHAFVNEKEIAMHANKYGLVDIELPKGDYELKLIYSPTKLVWPAAAIIATALMLLLLLKSADGSETKQI